MSEKLATAYVEIVAHTDQYLADINKTKAQVTSDVARVSAALPCVV